MRRFAGLCMAACLTLSAPLTVSAVFAEEVASTEETGTEESSAEDVGSASAEVDPSELNIMQNLDGVSVPAGSEQISYNLNGTAIQAAKTANGLYLLPVDNGDGTVQWYVYNEAANLASPYVEFGSNQEGKLTFVILPADESVTVPEAYEKVEISIGGQSLPAWFNPYAGDENMYLIYAMDSTGRQGLFRFDGSTGDSLRFVEDATVPTEETVATSDPVLLQQITRFSNEASIADQNYDTLSTKRHNELFIGLVTLGLLALLALILLIILISQSSKLKKARKALAEKERSLKSSSSPSSKYSESGIRVKDRNSSTANLEDTRLKDGKEEGTSRVRQTARSASSALENSTTTSNAVRVPKTVRRSADAISNVAAAVDDEANEIKFKAEDAAKTADTVKKAAEGFKKSADSAISTAEKKTVKTVKNVTGQTTQTGQAVKKVKNGSVKKRPSSLQSTAKAVPDGKTIIMNRDMIASTNAAAKKSGLKEKVVDDLAGLDDVAAEVSAVVEPDDGKPPIDTIGLEKIAEQLNYYSDEEDSQVVSNLKAAVEKQKAVAENKAKKVVKKVEEVIDDDDFEDFSLTDFKDI